MKIPSSHVVKTVLILAIVLSIHFTAMGQSSNSVVAPTNATPSVAAPDSTNMTNPAPLPSDGIAADVIIKKTKETYAALKSYSDSGTGSTKMGSFSTSVTFTIRLQRPGFYFVDWQSAGPMGKGVVWSDGTGDFLQAPALGLKKETSREIALASATGISGGVAAGIPGTFFCEAWGNKLFGEHQRQADEKVDGIDCYVLTHTLDHDGNKMVTTLWIGRQDSLIHQLKTKMDNTPKMPPITDESLTKTLALENKPATPEALDALRKQLTTARDMADSMLKSGGIEFTELHTNIVTDKAFTPGDFKPATN